jgi:hypothetical protein
VAVGKPQLPLTFASHTDDYLNNYDIITTDYNIKNYT